MNKTLAIILGSVLVVTLGAMTFALNNKNTKLEKENSKQVIEIDKLSEENTINLERIGELEVKVEELEARIAEYEQTIKELKAKISRRDKTIKTYQGKIKRRNKTINDLKNEIEQLARMPGDNSGKIAELEAEKQDLLAKIKEYDERLANAVDDKEYLKKKEEEEKLKKLRAERIANVVENTAVVFQSVEARERKDSRELKKVKNPKKWRYTNLQFYLQHKDGPKAIMDENFAVIIRDLDTGRVLPFNEGNPKFPGSKKETGVDIRYNGNMFIVDYYNNDPKKGTNFAVELYYVLNGERFPLPNGSKRIITDAKVLKI